MHTDRGSSCGTINWKAARALATVPGRLARTPSIAVNDGITYVLGNNVPTLLKAFAPNDLLTIVTLDGRTIAPPHGDHLFMHPRAAFDAQKRMHLIWGEPMRREYRESVMWIQANTSELWTAVRDTNGGWTEPKLLYSGVGTLLWNPQFTSHLSGSRGRLGFAVPVINAQPRIAFVQFENGAWSVREFVGQSGISAATAIRNNDFYVAYLSAANGVGQDINSVFLITSADRGNSWSLPELVQRSGTSPANALRLEIGTDGVLHLLWDQWKGQQGHVIRHFVRPPGSGVWKMSDNFPQPNSLGTVQTAIDACDRLHVVFESYDNLGARGSVAYAQWNGRWSASQNLFEEMRPMDPALTILPDGRIGLAMSLRIGNDTNNLHHTAGWAESRE
ncbi:MAG: hypothetical protein JWM95_5183 [Gemmatimonadetes bacterium]|nr:hypothetical protein [Gemmatimonadota bacterium]